jgi:SAM-dependent methyltransferase
VTAIDIAGAFLRAARADEAADPLGIAYAKASAVDLPFPDASFDFVCSIMCLMDVADVESALAEVHRVLRPGGFLQFSICHPCFDTLHRRNLRGPDGKTYALEVGRYFEHIPGRVVEWIFSVAPEEVKRSVRPFRTPYFTRTLSAWLNLLVDAGFVIERLAEPRPSDEVVARWPNVQDAQVVAYFLHVRGRKG